MENAVSYCHTEDTAEKVVAVNGEDREKRFAPRASLIARRFTERNGLSCWIWLKTRANQKVKTF